MLIGVHHLWGAYGEVFTAMTKQLVAAGLPVFLCDDQGWYVLRNPPNYDSGDDVKCSQMKY